MPSRGDTAVNDLTALEPPPDSASKDARHTLTLAANSLFIPRSLGASRRSRDFARIALWPVLSRDWRRKGGSSGRSGRDGEIKGRDVRRMTVVSFQWVTSRLREVRNIRVHRDFEASTTISGTCCDVRRSWDDKRGRFPHSAGPHSLDPRPSPGLSSPRRSPPRRRLAATSRDPAGSHRAIARASAAAFVRPFKPTAC